MKSFGLVVLAILLLGFQKTKLSDPALTVFIEYQGIYKDSTNNKANLKLKVTLQNNTRFNLILYNIFGKPLRPLFQEDSVCDEIVTTKTILIFDQHNALVTPKTFAIVSDSIDYTAMTLERVQNKLDRAKLDFAKSTTIIRSRQRMTFLETIDLSHLEFNSHPYYVKLMYSSGASVDYSIDETLRSSLQNSKNNKEYRDCIKSNRIKVIL